MPCSSLFRGCFRTTAMSLSLLNPSSVFLGFVRRPQRMMICHSAHVRLTCCAVDVDHRLRCNQQVRSQFHSSRALEFADFLGHVGPDRDGMCVESTISKHRRSLREKLKRGDGRVSKQILDSLARKNIDEWKQKFTKLLSDRDEQELVSREKKDWRDFNLLSAVATKMGLYCHRYARAVVFSKAPLPNYRPDLDDSRPQREVILPPGVEDEVACLLKGHLSQKSMSRRHLANIFLSRSSNHDGIFANERFCEPQKIFMRKSALEKIRMRKSWDIRHLQQEWQESPLGRNMLQCRKMLPIFKEIDALIKLIAENQVVIVSGETGCGKTTQLPQYILESEIKAMRGATCSIICTQPRRISAITVSERVASERGEPIGESVGYKIRLERETGRETRLLYCTTGILLRKFIDDRSLRGVTHVIVDEIHERGMHEDFLLIILKEILPRRPDLKVVLMSATLNAELFASYFGGAPVIHIPGFTHPVKEHFLEDILEETGYRLTPENQIDNYGPEKMLMRKNSQPLRRNNHLVYPVRGTLKTADFRNCSPKTRVSLSLWNPNAIGFNLIEHVLCNIVKSKRPGAALVFLTGWEDIKSLKDQLQSNPLLGNRRKVLLLACHSVMPSYEQKLIFEKPANGMRKIVLATNIAETSITIDDVVFVIDCGKAKESSYDALNNIPCLLSSWISKASARQRRGRAGRVQPGECYHLYPRCVYDSFADYQLPEILRTPLESLCLHIKSLQLGSISEFLSKAMQPPEALSVQNAIEYLKIIGALDEKENLTVLGQYLTKLPVEPKLGKMLVLGAIFKCLDPVLVIVASLSLRDPFVAPFDKKDDADLARVEISFRNCSDHLTLVRAFEGWRDAERNFSAQDYCQKNSLSQQTLQSIDSLSRKYFFALSDIGLVGDRQSCNIRSHDEYLIRGVICAALFPGVCSVENRMNSVAVRTVEDGQVLISNSSVNAMLRKIPYPWLVFNEKIKVNTVNIRDSTGVSDSLLLLFGGSISRHEDGHLSMLDGYFDFYMTPGLADLYVSLKKELDEMVQMKLLNPHMDVESYSGVFAAVRLLASQDQCAGKFVVGREKPLPKATGNDCMDDTKTQLKTWLAREGRDPPSFRTKRLDNNQFLSMAVVNGKYFMGKPCSTEKLSESDAAAEALLRLQGKCCSSFLDANSPRLDCLDDSDSEDYLRRVVNDR